MFTRRGRRHFAVLWVGAEEARFVPADDPGDDAPILWYLTYIPLHGFETVARAAALLADDGRTFRLVGDGQRRAAAEQLAARARPHQHGVRRAGRRRRSCAAEIARASICLGVFGTSDKAARVVPNKVFQCAAAGRAVVTAATPAVQRAFGDALVTVPVGDRQALADAIRDAPRPDAPRRRRPRPRRVRAALLRSRARRRARPHPHERHPSPTHSEPA